MKSQEIRIPALPYLLVLVLILASFGLDQFVLSTRHIIAETFNATIGLAVLSILKLVFALLAVLLIFTATRRHLSKPGAVIFLVFGLGLALSPLWMELPIRAGDILLFGSYLALSGAILAAVGLARLILNQPKIV